MGWRVAAQAEVAGCSHQALAEVVHPDAVDHDARGQRVVLAGDGPGQFQPAAALAERLPLVAGQHLQVTPRQMDPDGRIKVHLELLGEHPAHTRKLHTDYTIERGGTIFVGGLRLDPQKPDAGTLLVAVTQALE